MLAPASPLQLLPPPPEPRPPAPPAPPPGGPSSGPCGEPPAPFLGAAPGSRAGLRGVGVCVGALGLDPEWGCPRLLPETQPRTSGPLVPVGRNPGLGPGLPNPPWEMGSSFSILFLPRRLPAPRGLSLTDHSFSPCWPRSQSRGDGCGEPRAWAPGQAGGLGRAPAPPHIVVARGQQGPGAERWLGPSSAWQGAGTGVPGSPVGGEVPEGCAPHPPPRPWDLG